MFYRAAARRRRLRTVGGTMNLPSPKQTLWGIVMAMIVRLTGGLMLAYSALYTAHFIFDTLYDVQPIWTVFNVISAVGILIALDLPLWGIPMLSTRLGVGGGHHAA